EHNEAHKHFGTYFLVTFLGKPFGDMNGEKFVYRRKGNTLLGDFCEEMKKKYESTLETNVNFVENEDKELNDNQAFLSVNHLKPISNFRDKNKFERSTYKNTFKYEVRLKNEEKMVYKVKVEHPFPTIVTRQKVLAISNETYSAVKVAHDDVQSRIDELNLVVSAKPLNISSLENLLVGTLLAQVNGGIKIYFENFYKTEKEDNLDKNELKQFEDALLQLVSVVDRSIKKYYMEINEKKLNEQKQDMYETLCEYYCKMEKLVWEKLG
ncbi:hypothetical protein MHBO_002027, partial [Bonamia ostreae]